MALTKEQFVKLSCAIADHALREAKLVGATRNELGAVLINVLESYADACVMEGIVGQIDTMVREELSKRDVTGHS